MLHTGGRPVHTTYYTRIRPLSAYRAAYSVCMHTGGRLLLRCDRSPSQEVGSPAAQSVGVADLRVVHKPLNSTRIIRRTSIISFSLEVSAFSQGNNHSPLNSSANSPDFEGSKPAHGCMQHIFAVPQLGGDCIRCILAENIGVKRVFSKRLLANTRGENGEETTKDPRNPFTPCPLTLWAARSDRVSRCNLHRVPFPFLSTSDVARDRRGCQP